jgi:hypothetical protein
VNRRQLVSSIVGATILISVALITGTAAEAKSLARVATYRSVLGSWVLVSVDGGEAEHPLPLYFREGRDEGTFYEVATSDLCNSVWWNNVRIDRNGSLEMGPTGPVQTKAGCRSGVQSDSTVKNAVGETVRLQRVDSDLLLIGSRRLQFRLVLPEWPSAATVESMQGEWSGGSINDMPVVPHVLQIGRRSPVESTRGPCAGVFIERVSLDERGLLTLQSEPASIPECGLSVDSRFLELLRSRPIVQQDHNSLILRTPLRFARFSQPIGPTAPSSLSIAERYPPRPAVPVSLRAAAGEWSVTTINGMKAPPGLWLRFPSLVGFDGCKSFRPRGTPRIDPDGSLRGVRLVVSPKPCSEEGFTWDPQLRKMLEGKVVAEFVGDTTDEIVLRSSSTPWTPGSWITLTRR